MKRTKISLLESLDKELDAEGKIKNFEKCRIVKQIGQGNLKEKGT